MSARSIFSAIVLGFAFCPALAFAQVRTDVVPEVANSNFAFAAVTNATAYVRSGPAESYYACMKLSKGSPLTVVGYKFEWLKVLPPEGSFSYVAKQYVDKGEGSIGKIKTDNVNVRAGSKLYTVKSAVQCKLNKDDEVTILGEAEEFYMIKPPPGAYFYVSQRVVEKVKQLAGAATQPAGNGNVASAERTRPPQIEVIGPSTTRPADATEIVAEPPKEAVAERAKAESEFDRLEAAFNGLAGTPIDQQPIPDLLTSFEKLSKNESLPASMFRIVEQRIRQLNAKNKIREEVLATMAKQEELRRKADVATRERQALEEKMNARLQVYTALGNLEASTFQPGGVTLYRITDPATGRTQCYVRSNDPKTPNFIGKFVGVRGELGTDPQISLQVVELTEITEVNPELVNTKITARVVPPSLRRGAGETAKTDQ